jgi:sialidase-1
MHATRHIIRTVAILASAFAFALPAFAASSDIQETKVFESRTDGYHTFRIPAIVVTNKGTLLAFCEGRKTGGGDAGNIDTVVSRSTDGGKTWSEPQVVWDDGDNTCGNPAPVVDRDTGTIWLPLTWNLGTDKEKQIMEGKSQEPRQVYVTSSTDDGVTWAKPTKISESVRKPHWRWYATGPGNAIQLKRGAHKGRLLIPANHSDHTDPEKHPYRSHVFWSDDHGKTWQLGGVHEDRTNESAVVELADGSVLQSMRSYHKKNNRAVSVSTDGGKTWGPVRLDDALQTPVCQGSVLRFTWPDASGDGKSRILFSCPKGSKRTNLTVWESFDEGKTWPVSKEIYDGSSAYSNLVDLDGGRIGVLYEKDNSKTITLASFDRKWLESNSQ